MEKREALRRRGWSITAHPSIENGFHNTDLHKHHDNLRRLVRRLLGPLYTLIIKLLLWTAGTVVIMDILYLEIESLRFGNPCQIAHDAKVHLSKQPRKLVGKAKPPRLPKIIHQQWKTDKIPEGMFSQYSLQWKKLFPEPEYKHILWTDKSGRKLIEEHFPWFLEVYDKYPINIQRADSMRYFILYMYGGIYADLDYEPFVNFWEALPVDRVGLIESPYKKNEQVQNSLMSSPPGDPFWNITFSLLYERRSDPRVLSSTGPALMDGAIHAAPDKTWVHILPCENFHRIPLGDAGATTPLIGRISRTLMAYTPLVKTCGNWARRDDCQFGLHHNAISYQENLVDNLKAFLSNL